MAGRTLLFWLLTAATVGVYVTMLVWSLPTISRAASGLTPFDMRPGGYTFDEARAFLAALSADGNAFYRKVQHRLDLFYPALLGATLFFAIALLTPASWGQWRWLLAAAAIPGAIFDYMENHAVATMLRLGAEGVTPVEVATASRWTVLKSQSTTVAMAILLALLLLWAGSKFRRRSRAG